MLAHGDLSSIDQMVPLKFASPVPFLGNQNNTNPTGTALTAKNPITLEVCISSVEDAVAACAGGADRLELCIAMELGGLTPSVALLEEVLYTVSVPVVVMVRPRAAGFRYTQVERCLILRDSQLLLAAGADGIVSGALREDGKFDFEFWQDLRRKTGECPLVFHRALDVVSDPSETLQQLIDSGTTRVLTSGGCKTAWEGRQQIARLQSLAEGRIEILAGAGITPSNAVPLIEATGCRQLHGSFSDVRDDPASCVAASTYPVTSEPLVAATRAALNECQL